MTEWKTSSKSFSNSNCVQVSEAGGMIAVRDSKDPDGPVLSFTPDQWRAFVQGARAGEFDHLTRHAPATHRAG
jgi:hypothetical protein